MTESKSTKKKKVATKKKSTKKKVATKEKVKRSHTEGYKRRAPIISIDKYNEMYSAWNERQTIKHVARTCQVNESTAKRYIEKGDPKRKLPSIRDRWERTQQQAQMAEDYSLVKARRQIQTVARAFLQRVSQRISKLEPSELSSDKIINQLQTTQTILERTLGVADQTVEVKAEDRFHGWSTDDLFEFARTGTLPEHARSVSKLIVQATERRKAEEE